MPTKLNVAAFHPAGTKIVIEPDFIKNAAAGLLIIPESVDQKTISPFGTIVSVGPGRKMESGAWFEVPFVPGQRVQVNSWRGRNIEVNGRQLLVTDYEVVDGVIEPIVEIPTNAQSN